MFSGTVYIHPYKVTQAFIAADLHSSQFRPLVLHKILIASPWRKVTPNTLHLSSLLQTLSTTREALKQNTCSWWEKASCTAEPLEFQKTVELFANTVEIILKSPQTSSCKDAFHSRNSTQSNVDCFTINWILVTCTHQILMSIRVQLLKRAWLGKAHLWWKAPRAPPQPQSLQPSITEAKQVAPVSPLGHPPEHWGEFNTYERSPSTDWIHLAAVDSRILFSRHYIIISRHG